VPIARRSAIHPTVIRRLSHEDQFAPVTAIHDVIKRASLLDSQLAGQTGGVALAASHINIKN
jgi:hypothetical protein